MIERVIGFAGAGFSCAVVARELVPRGPFKAVIYDERTHVAGNCHTSRDSETGIMVHHYGPHIFHTSNEHVWNYVQRWGRFENFSHQVKASTAKGIFHLPINLRTLNEFFGKKMSPSEAEKFVQSLGDRSIGEPKNFEEQALKMLGRELYDNFFYGYTKKQWGVEPRQLSASILKRLPIRFTEDLSYFNDPFQGIPRAGYTAIVENILDHPKIEVRLGERLTREGVKNFEHVFYSGPLDGYFSYQLGKLNYRTVTFEEHRADGDFQNHSVVNYCEERIPYTRIAEHKHFAPWEKFDRTVYFKEFSKQTEDGDTPFYPMRLDPDKKLLQDYIKLAEQETAVTFLGRLGTYRYLDMHVVIEEALKLAEVCLNESDIKRWPHFSTSPLSSGAGG